MEAKKGLYKKLAYHFVMNNFTVPQSLEGLKVESCKAFAKSFHDVTALSRAIANGTAIAADARSRLMMARTAEFRSAIDSEKMVNAWEVTRHWDGHHLQAANAWLLKDFAGIGVDFKKMRPRKVAEQLAKAQKQGKDVFRPVMDRARYVILFRNSGSLASLRSGVRQWHVFAVSVLHYKVDLSAPPRSSEHVLCWLSCFAHHGTAMNYLG